MVQGIRASDDRLRHGGTVVIANNRSIRGLRTGDTTEVDDPEAEGVIAYYAPIQFGGGVLALAAEVTADPSYGIKNSSAPIAISNDTDRVFASALAASNVGGLTKKGAGTLTLSEKPLYTGWTTVKAGKLIVPEGTSLDVVIGAGGELEGATYGNVKFADDGYTFTVGTDETIVATGAADVSNLTVYIANPASAESITIVRAGSVTGTPSLAFPAGTSEKVKAKWSLKVTGGTLRASSIAPFSITLR